MRGTVLKEADTNRREGPNNGSLKKREEGEAMCGEQKTVTPERGETGYPGKDRMESEGPQEARSIETRKTTDSVGGRKTGRSMLDQVLELENLWTAHERVIRNLPRASGFLGGLSRRDK